MENSPGKIEVLKGDITKVSVDAIVNAANTSLLGGGGVDGAIHREGGKAILDDCKEIISRQGGCKTGEAVITAAGNLPAKFVIHTVGPVWNGGKNNESKKLTNCYRNSLQLAIENDCRTIAFPGISTGVYKFPKKEAAEIAMKTVKEFLLFSDKIEKVVFVCYDDEYFFLLQNKLISNIGS
jgi:O-acetyl-ADP-ribose deacetylase